MMSRTWIALIGFAASYAYGQTCENTTVNIPSSGFVFGISDGIRYAFKVKSKARVPICSKLTISGAPDFVGDSTFYQVEGKLANDKAYFKNERYILSFVTAIDDRPYGTWIIGNTPGVDSGVGYIKAPHPHFIPVFPASGGVWNWIFDGVWEVNSETSITCLDTFSDMDIAEVMYISNEKQVSTLLRANGSTVQVQDPSTREWTLVELDPESTITLGAAVTIVDTAKTACRGHLVNIEFHYSYWHLMFHCHNNNATEVFLHLDEGGLRDQAGIQPFPGDYAAISAGILVDAAPGEWFWMWYEPKGTAHRSVTSLLLQCTARIGGSAVFKYYDENRRDVMQRSVLSYLVDVVKANASGVYIAGAEVELVSALPLGMDLVQWLRAYLVRHEGRFGGLPSCYLYHAAIAMPQPLVYLAELVCVLLGSKPLTMIQYTTSADYQWKFPLTIEMTQKLIAYAASNASFELDYRVFKYRTDETLVVFNKRQEYLVSSLRPASQAQALHIAPYPENDETLNQRVFELQLYNSWWNGFVLGYPEYFIDSYCLDFHNDLSKDEKRVQMNLAKAEVKAYFVKHQYAAVQIKLGLNAEVSRSAWDFLSANASCGL